MKKYWGEFDDIFFFQAEDGIRALLVTGVQTCALPIFAASFAAVDSRLLAASAVLGASSWRLFFRDILPLSIPSLVTGVALRFAHTVGEFGVVLMIGGNIPGVTRTVSIDIYDQVQAANYSTANHTALVLLIFSFVVLSLVYALNRRVWAVWPFK